MTPGLRVIAAITSAEVAICGTHFGDTNEAASMLTNPACDRRLTRWILTSAEIVSFSFCKPSRGPTSTILTCLGKVISISFRAIDDARHRFAALQRTDLAS